jgi:hypothetical protein
VPLREDWISLAVLITFRDNSVICMTLHASENAATPSILTERTGACKGEGKVSKGGDVLSDEIRDVPGCSMRHSNSCMRGNVPSPMSSRVFVLHNTLLTHGAG